VGIVTDSSSSGRPRARDLGLILGRMPPGPLNAITDVGDVRVGQVTLHSGEGALREGAGPVRTGVTVVLPHSRTLFREKLVAAVHVINGFGKMTGTTQVEELGVIETAIALTNTLSVGAAFDGLVEHALRQNPEIGLTTGSVNPVVGECNDGYLNDMRGRHVRPEHVIEAIERATGGPVKEGAVGAGTGMTCYGWKGGIGTASRRLPAHLGGFILGALVLANFGDAHSLMIAGMPIGDHVTPPRTRQPPTPGSCIIILATDAPASSRQLGRIARRAQNGLARTGSTIGHGSGDYVIAFSTARTVPHWPSDLVLPAEELAENGPLMDALFLATVEATEEAVINALFTADTTDGIDGHVRYGLPVDGVVALVRPGDNRA
jgi:D-aminopeptidase